MAVQTRNKSTVFLVGHEEKEITGSKLPSNRQALSLFFHHHRKLKKTIRESAAAVISEIEAFWEKARIPTQAKKNSIPKLEKLHQEWKKLQKSASRQKGPTQQEKEGIFVNQLEDLFDIAHQDALDLIPIVEDRDFLLAQREVGRRGYMSGADKILAKKELRTARRQELTEKRKKRSLEQQCLATATVSSENIISSDDDTELQCGNMENGQGNSQSRTFGEAGPSNPKKRARINVLSTSLTQTLDRTKTSDRNATFIIAATAQSLGHNFENLVLNRSSIRRARNRIRREVAMKLKEGFQGAPTLVVHWDGKLLPAITGVDRVERLPVIVSGLGEEQLLGVPKLKRGTGKEQASAVVLLLREWNLVDKVQGMCFDTTSSNTGRTNGACVLLEQKLGKRLLHFPCRHHIYELVLAAVFQESMGSSSSPEIGVFKRFRQTWAQIDPKNFEVGVTDHQNEREALDKEKSSILSFATEQLKELCPREDYRELLELSVIFLGGTPPRGKKIRAPGALHQARWMAKAVYSLKIFMYRKQFHLTPREEKGLLDVCMFVLMLYIKRWFLSPVPASAPNNDLLFLQELLNFEKVNPAVSRIALAKFSGHLWYISEELVSLALFDPAVSRASKQEIVTAMKQREGNPDPPRRLQLEIRKPEEVKTWKGKKLQDFATSNSLTLFSRLGIKTSFLEIDPILWEQSADFCYGEKTVRKLKVVNDCAERGVALIQEYNSQITKNEDQKQYLLQVVKNHRQKFPDCKKETLAK